MSLSSKQRDLCEKLGLSERLVEAILDAAPALPDYCTTCRQRPCVCTISEFPFGMGESAETPEEKEAKQSADLATKATREVIGDFRKKHNTQKDSVTFYPSTDQPTKS